ncbi:uncharacterized protein JCM15063_002124 [Sporobolomyces koalae]|uniref:uncharacterized protein n=1 Tax=Sporobolomyces koalae TaxID=500713 RepID=UPI003178997B
MKGLLVLYLFSLAIAISSLGLSIASLVHPNWFALPTSQSRIRIGRSTDAEAGNRIITRPFSSHHDLNLGTLDDSPINLSMSNQYGLFETCTTTTYTLDAPQRRRSGLTHKVECRKFPQRSIDCQGKEGAAFCDRWLLAGYAHQLSLIFSITSILSVSLTLVGTATVGKGYRTEKLRSGWKLVVGLFALELTTLAIAWIIILWEYHHEKMFSIPWGHKRLGSAFVESVTAFGLLIVAISTIVFVRITQRLRIVASGAAREDGYQEISS